MTKTFTYMLSAALWIATIGAINMAAQDAADQQQPGVARASLLEGSVSTQRGNAGDWDTLTPNTPLFSGDSVATGPDSRAEIQLDYANVVRLSDSADFRIANLSPSQIQIQLGNGLFSYSEIRAGDARVEIDTPNVAIHPLGQGNYRIWVDASGQTQVFAWNTAADIVTSQGTTRVERGQMITIEGIDNPQYRTSATPALDGWDRWNMDRDRTIFNAQSWKNTNQYYVGSSDLDSYGRWDSVPDYGNVWFPTQNVGWAPYRDGRWVWGPYYGWTWASYEPWGWAPYHYGRWFVYGGRWGWWPGPVVGYRSYRPVWAPAYVSFFGFGSGGFSLSFGYSNVGWLPIGPADSYYPWYGRYARGVNVVNINTVINIGHDGHRDGWWAPLARPGIHPYSNLRDVANDRYVRSGFSSMAAGQFGHGRVPTAQRPWDGADFSRGGGVLTGGLPFSADRASYRSTDRPVNPRAVPSRDIRNERFFADQRAGANPAHRPAAGRDNQPSPQPSGTGGRSFGAAGAPVQSPTRPQPQADQQRGREVPSARPGWNSFNRQNQTSGAADIGAPGRGNRPSQPTFTAPRQGEALQPTYNPPSQSLGRWSTPQQLPERQNNFGGDNGARGGFYGKSADRPAAGNAAPQQNSGRDLQRGPSNRPPLDLRQQVVTPRGNDGANAGRSVPGAGARPQGVNPSDGGGDRGQGRGNEGQGNSRGGETGRGHSGGRGH